MTSSISSSRDEYGNEPLLETGQFPDTVVYRATYRPTNEYPMWLTWLNLTIFLMSFFCLLGTVAIWSLAEVPRVPVDRPDIIYCMLYSIFRGRDLLPNFFHLSACICRRGAPDRTLPRDSQCHKYIQSRTKSRAWFRLARSLWMLVLLHGNSVGYKFWRPQMTHSLLLPRSFKRSTRRVLKSQHARGITWQSWPYITSFIV